ncbi:benzoate 4-monooxygenase cytochrome P450 [Fusarium beomiforme]|uniref:Benzoate 4-monooxygenase cytochrome P450 n=1 Tax=Fusarium beomiforme TaxID=44412 RepID=A0A9P5AA21_9HYPO|nr:benzoate 4-monooxygenase cytochrome P450 [Fusarium beomiforme]
MAHSITSVVSPHESLGSRALIAGIVLLILVQFGRYFTSTIRRFPGPFWAKLSSFWLASQCRKVRRSEVVLKLHQKHGDFVQIGPNHVSINNPAAIQQIYGHKTGFTKGPFYDAFHQVTPVVFNTRNVSEHTRKRKYINPAFSSRALSDFEPYMDAEILAWKQQLLKMSHESNAYVDFAVWTNYLAFDVIASFAFGEPFGFIEKGRDDYGLIKIIDTRGEFMNALGSLSPFLRSLMKYNPLDAFWKSGFQASAGLAKIGREAFEKRKESADNSRKDLLSFLFSAKDPDTKQPIPEDEIVAESISFIVGGSDTTSSTMTNFIDFLSRDADLQQRIQEEIDTLFPGEPSDDWVPSDKKLNELPLLLSTLREVMRFRPTSATGLERVTPPGGKSIAGQFIHENIKTLVSVPTLGVMMDPRIFELPEVFRPERWLEPGAERLMEFFYPFSTGPRACIGRNFAWMEILKAVVIIFKLFDVKRANPEPTVVREGFFNKAVECKVEIRKRWFS